MLMRYIKGDFSEQYNVTVGVEFATKTVEVAENKSVKLQIWDTVHLINNSGGPGGIQSNCEIVLQGNRRSFFVFCN